jgi:hypothetical protein
MRCSYSSLVALANKRAVRMRRTIPIVTVGKRIQGKVLSLGEDGPSGNAIRRDSRRVTDCEILGSKCYQVDFKTKHDSELSKPSHREGQFV